MAISSDKHIFCCQTICGIEFIVWLVLYCCMTKLLFVELNSLFE